MKHTKHKMSSISLYAFVTEDLLLGGELVEAAFTTKMNLQTGAPLKIKNITIKQGKYVMILFFYF